MEFIALLIFVAYALIKQLTTPPGLPPDYDTSKPRVEQFADGIKDDSHIYIAVIAALLLVFVL